MIIKINLLLVESKTNKIDIHISPNWLLEYNFTRVCNNEKKKLFPCKIKWTWNSIIFKKSNKMLVLLEAFLML